MIARVAPLALALLLTGCTQTKPPTFEVGSLTITERSDSAAVLSVEIVGTNNSSTPLELRDVNYTLAIDSATPVTTTRDAQATLPANKQQRLRLPVVIDTTTLNAIEGVDTPYRFSATISYLRPGKFAEVLYDLGIQKASRSFSESATLRIPVPE
ncbi:MAG: hypothetical protein ACF8GE_08345 [Phycisphaerales bacterium JB043]